MSDAPTTPEVTPDDVTPDEPAEEATDLTAGVPDGTYPDDGNRFGYKSDTPQP